MLNSKKKRKKMQIESKCKARSNAEFKEKEKMQTLSESRARSNVDFKNKEKIMQRVSKGNARNTLHFQEKEKAIRLRSKRKARTDPVFLLKERISEQTLRSNVRIKVIENIHDRQRKIHKRKDPDKTESEASNKKKH